MTLVDALNRSPRVMILNYEYPPLGGGAGTATKYLMEVLAKTEGISAELITSSSTSQSVERLSDNSVVHFLDIGKSGSLHYQSQSDLSVYAARSFFYAKRLLRKKSFDVVHAFFGIPCGVVAMGLGLPYIVSLRGSDVPFYNKRFEKMDSLLFQRLSRSVWHRASYVVANSQGLKDLALQSSPNQFIKVIPNGVDTNFFLPHQKKTQKNTITIISTGRLIERKGYRYLIEALKDLPNIRLQLVGDGNLSKPLKELSEKCKVSVEFLGIRNRTEVAKLLSSADLFVLPSLNEGMSNSLLEAMSCGLPAIVTNVGGTIELVQKDKNGFVVPKADAFALRAVIKKYISNPNLLNLHGLESRQKALNMSIEENARQYIELYHSASLSPSI